MKNLNYNKIFAMLGLILFQTSLLMADNNYPPTPGAAGGFDDDFVVGGAIDSYLPLLFMLALVLGSVMIAKIKSEKSTL